MKHKNPIVDKKIRDEVSETKRNIKKSILWLDNMKLADYTVVSVPINNDLAVWLKKYFALNRKFPDEVENLIHERLIESGVLSYHQISSFTPPDHVMSPPALAYLLSQSEGYFPKFRAEAIKFDHGDTLETFKKQADGLFANVTKQLATPRIIKKISKNKREADYDPHPVCDCCC